MIEALIARAKIIEGNADTGLPQGAEHGLGRVEVADQRTLADLEFETMRPKTGSIEDGRNLQTETGGPQQDRREAECEARLLEQRPARITRRAFGKAAVTLRQALQVPQGRLDPQVLCHP